MVCASLDPLRLRTKHEPTGKKAAITRGVPQGPPSSPIYFIVYIDELAKEVKGVMGESGRRSGEAICVAEDVLFQASSRQALQTMLNEARRWKDCFDPRGMVKKSSYLQITRGVENGAVYLDGETGRSEKERHT